LSTTTISMGDAERGGPPSWASGESVGSDAGGGLAAASSPAIGLGVARAGWVWGIGSGVERACGSASGRSGAAASRTERRQAVMVDSLRNVTTMTETTGLPGCKACVRVAPAGRAAETGGVSRRGGGVESGVTESRVGGAGGDAVEWAILHALVESGAQAGGAPRVGAESIRSRRGCVNGRRKFAGFPGAGNPRSPRGKHSSRRQ
jgi:hypothetical protein